MQLARLGLGEGTAERERFLRPRLAELTRPDAMVDRSTAARRLARAVRENERIVVFGDYDCDGMTATAILTDALRELGASSVTPVLASRFAGGYGLSARALERVLEAEPSLVITCDCGSSDHPSLERLRQRGVDAVVIDHHLVPAEPLPALAFLNPHRPDCGFAYKGLASCGLAFSVVAALRSELGAQLDPKGYLDLVAIGTIADVAPLDGDNRALVRAGLAQLAKTQRPGLAALCDLIGLDRSRPLVASDVSFRLAPRLNAPGRLGAPDRALELMLEKDQGRAQGLAAAVEQSCQLRRETQKSIEAEAEEDAERHAGEHSIVVGRRGWNHGIVGIVAGRLADRRGLPVVVVGFGDQGGGHGSVRGPAGFPLFDAVEAASEALVRFGGHQAAAGLELPFERLQEFREAFDRACGCRSPSEAAAAPEPLAVESSDDLWAVYEDLRELEPCGQTNPRPRLQLSGRVRASRALRGNHLKLELEPAPGQRLAVFAPGFGELAVSIGQRVTVVGDLRVDAYRGGEALEFLAEQVSVEPVTSEPTTAAPPTSEPSTSEPPKR